MQTILPPAARAAAHGQERQRTAGSGTRTAAELAARWRERRTPIGIGEINSYKAQPAFLDLCRKGWEPGQDQVDAAGGISGRKLEIARDDGTTPDDAVRVAEELLSREKVDREAGGFLSHIGLVLTDFAKQERVFFRNLRFAQSVADRAYIIEKGRIRFSGTMAELDANDEIRAAATPRRRQRCRSSSTPER